MFKLNKPITRKEFIILQGSLFILFVMVLGVAIIDGIRITEMNKFCQNYTAWVAEQNERLNVPITGNYKVIGIIPGGEKFNQKVDNMVQENQDIVANPPIS